MCDVSQKWVDVVLDFAYDQIDVDEFALCNPRGPARSAPTRDRRTPLEIAGHWSTAYFEYWDGENQPARSWQRSGL
jgi:hypothetical protein